MNLYDFGRKNGLTIDWVSRISVPPFSDLLPNLTLLPNSNLPFSLTPNPPQNLLIPLPLPTKSSPPTLLSNPISCSSTTVPNAIASKEAGKEPIYLPPQSAREKKKMYQIPGSLPFTSVQSKQLQVTHAQIKKRGSKWASQTKSLIEFSQFASLPLPIHLPIYHPPMLMLNYHTSHHITPPPSPPCINHFASTQPCQS